MKSRISFSTLCLLLLIRIQVGSALAADSCPALVQRALTTVADVCAGLGRNEACYGNDHLEAQLDAMLSQPFVEPADRTPVESIRSLQTFPLDEQNGTWGVAFLQIQANLPETLPGQSVKFILYGDVTLQNAATTGDSFNPMQAFYFVSGLQPTCKEAPPSSLVIQSPQGYRVNLRANGLDLSVGSSVALTAQKNEHMRLTTLQGEVFVTYDGETRVVPQGFETALELGGEDGLTPQGVPQTVYLMDDEEWQVVAAATEEVTGEPLDLLDTDQYANLDDYCDDPANAEMCADRSIFDSLEFDDCPPDVCDILIEEPDVSGEEINTLDEQPNTVDIGSSDTGESSDDLGDGLDTGSDD
ncbi:MAG: hypothetical protein R3E39_25455 [Anaerolineae bacterium]